MPDCERVPVGLRKLQDVGLYNVIFELDLGDTTYDFSKFTIDMMCALLKKWVAWCHQHLDKDAKVFVSFRDLPDVMPSNSKRVFKVSIL